MFWNISQEHSWNVPGIFLEKLEKYFPFTWKKWEIINISWEIYFLTDSVESGKNFPKNFPGNFLGNFQEIYFHHGNVFPGLFPMEIYFLTDVDGKFFCSQEIFRNISRKCKNFCTPLYTTIVVFI